MVWQEHQTGWWLPVRPLCTAYFSHASTSAECWRALFLADAQNRLHTKASLPAQYYLVWRNVLIRIPSKGRAPVTTIQSERPRGCSPKEYEGHRSVWGLYCSDGCSNSLKERFFIIYKTTFFVSYSYLLTEYLDQRLSPSRMTCPFSMRLFSSRWIVFSLTSVMISAMSLMVACGLASRTVFIRSALSVNWLYTK